MHKSFDKKCLTFEEFKKQTDCVSTPGTDGDIKVKEPIKKFSRNIKDITVKK